MLYYTDPEKKNPLHFLIFIIEPLCNWMILQSHHILSIAVLKKMIRHLQLFIYGLYIIQIERGGVDSSSIMMPVNFERCKIYMFSVNIKSIFTEFKVHSFKR